MSWERPKSLGDHIAQVGRWSVGHMVIGVEEYLFDYVFYPLMLYGGGQAMLNMLLRVGGLQADPPAVAGYWFGFALLTAASVVINLFYIQAYDRMRTDWFGFEALKTALERFGADTAGGPAARAVARWVAFVLLSTWRSPLFGTLFMRGSADCYAMTPRDWRVFWTALLIANVGWAGLVSGVVEGGKRLLSLLG